MLYEAEEFIVQGHWSDERRLNMVPGGKSALRYMRENNMIKSNVIPHPDKRDSIVQTWLKDHPRKGLPAPWMSEKWKDNNRAMAQICIRGDRLSIKQVQAIRQLSNQHSAEEIASRIGAHDTQQVVRVLAGTTYSRIE